MKKPLSSTKVVEHPFFGLACFVAILFVLPRYGLAAMMIGCASVLATYVAAIPDRFRTRNGSLTAAVCLVTAMWAAAMVLVWREGVDRKNRQSAEADAKSSLSGNVSVRNPQERA
jgi:urea transporter